VACKRRRRPAAATGRRPGKGGRRAAVVHPRRRKTEGRRTETGSSAPIDARSSTRAGQAPACRDAEEMSRQLGGES
jgi:hypothetical protein